MSLQTVPGKKKKIKDIKIKILTKSFYQQF